MTGGKLLKKMGKNTQDLSPKSYTIMINKKHR